MPQTTTAPRKKTRLMTEGGIFKNLLLFAVPLILGNLLQQFYNVADTLIVGGTSLNVYPAAGLIRYYRGNKLVLINRDETPYDTYANLIFRDPIGKVLGAI